ncbi:hypothetical protein BDV39DRAFT_170461 [Aspergillus sergii]|uniref:Uncharacterized protein n=1 Tax=Aspergillus sergii TaxID=1034303 RepID=A0A5N6XFH8_9EURO|nr:hypothetical protein BDV39DRAFT_170461 [Aspergillus sergii]
MIGCTLSFQTSAGLVVCQMASRLSAKSCQAPARHRIRDCPVFIYPVLTSCGLSLCLWLPMAPTVAFVL